MISAVSFGSTYQIHSNQKMSIDKQFGYHNLTKYCKDNKIPYNEKAQYNVKHLYGNTEYNIDTVIVVPDKQDVSLEAFMAMKGVNYVKFETDKLLQTDSINKRIAQAPDGFKTVVINSDKLGQILRTQEDNNFRETRRDYRRHHKKEADFMLKSGWEIPVSTLYLTTWLNPEDELPRIEKGLLEPNAVAFNFAQRTNLPDHCMYMAMKEAGVKDIPVYMTNGSYQAAKALGIVEE